MDKPDYDNLPIVYRYANGLVRVVRDDVFYVLAQVPSIGYAYRAQDEEDAIEVARMLSNRILRDDCWRYYNVNIPILEQ